MVRKGYANPSFAADSAARISLRFFGTCLIANLPPKSRSINVISGSLIVSPRCVRTNYSRADNGVGRRKTGSDGERRYEVNGNKGNKYDA